MAGQHPGAVWLHKALRECRHSVHHVTDWRDGVFVAEQEAFDAIIVMCAERADYAALFDMLRRLSSSRGGAVLITVLGAATTQDRVSALRMGADACFDHPYSFLEINECLRAYHRTALGNLVCWSSDGKPNDKRTHEPKSMPTGLRLVVTQRETLMLECLMREVDLPVSRERLIRYCWQDKDDVDRSTVTILVSRLRRKLAVHMPNARIETISRYGYRLTFLAA